MIRSFYEGPDGIQNKKVGAVAPTENAIKLKKSQYIVYMKQIPFHDLL